MKKALMIGLVLLLGIAFGTCVFAQSVTEKATKAATDVAQDKAKASGDTLKTKATKAVAEKAAPTPAPTAAAPEKKAEKEVTVKAKSHRFTGEVTAIDMAAKTLTVKGKKGEKTFDVANAKMKVEPKAGDKVRVKYTETDGKMVAKYVSVKGAKKVMKKKAAPADKPMAPEKAVVPAPAK